MSKGSLKKKLTLLLTAVSFTIVILTLLALLTALIFNKYFSEKDDLTKVSSAFRTLIDQTTDDAIVTEKFYAIIHEQVGDLDEQSFIKYSYSVFNEVGDQIFKYPEKSKDIETIQKIDKSILNKDYDAVIVKYDDWIFYNRLQGKGFSVAVTSRSRLDFINSIILTFTIISPFILAMCFIAASILSRRMHSQLNIISDAAQKIASGNYDTRIPPLKTNDEREDLVKTLNETFSQLEESISRIQRFSSDVAHELRTPLTAIMGNLEVALSSGDRTFEEYENTLIDSMEEMTKLKKIVDVLLLISKPKDNFIDSFKTFNLCSVIESTIENLGILAEDKEIKITFTNEQDAEVKGLKDIIERAVTNLIHNAIKFSPSGSEISVKISSDKKFSYISVIDQGPGISGEDQKRIFERFFQSDSSRNQGSGLGLSLVDWAAKIHEGSIKVDSLPGKGAVFTLSLPKKL